jgi:radical SAM protein with 4Fe4S-binding SPASM domain
MSEYAFRPEEIESLSKQFFADKDINDEYIVYKKDEQGLKPKIDYKKCSDVNRVFTVLADGRAVMCCFDLYGDYVYGEMDKNNLEDLWKSAKVRAMRQTAQNRKFPLCKKCGNIE